MELRIPDLKESNDFLNDLYSNVTSAIFIADRDARLVSFNNAFHSLFYKPEDQLLGVLCGNAIGCAYQLREGVDCGNTTQCDNCELRNNIITSFTEKVPVYKCRLDRDFNVCGTMVRKHFVFTTKYASYQGQEYVLVLVDDCTDLIVAQENLSRKNEQLEKTVRDLSRQLLSSALDLDVSRTRTEELGRELRHRVGNTLQLIVSLLQLLSERESCPESGYESLSLYLSAIITAYQHVNYENGYPGVDASKLLPALCALLEDHQNACAISSRLDVAIVSLDIAVPLSIAMVDLLLSGLVSSSCSVHLELSALNASFAIKVSLNQTPAGANRHWLLEHTLCDLLIKQLAGQIDYPAAGCVRFVFPLPDGQPASATTFRQS